MKKILQTVISLDFMFIAFLLFYSGCATGSSKATVILPMDDSREYVILSKSDALVEFEKNEKGEIKMKVDNRGRPSLLEKLMGWMFIGMPNLNIGK